MCTARVTSQDQTPKNKLLSTGAAQCESISGGASAKGRGGWVQVGGGAGWSDEKGNRIVLSENRQEGPECRDIYTHTLQTGIQKFTHMQPYT